MHRPFFLAPKIFLRHQNFSSPPKFFFAPRHRIFSKFFSSDPPTADRYDLDHRWCRSHVATLVALAALALRPSQWEVEILGAVRCPTSRTTIFSRKKRFSLSNQGPCACVSCTRRPAASRSYVFAAKTQKRNVQQLQLDPGSDVGVPGGLAGVDGGAARRVRRPNPRLPQRIDAKLPCRDRLWIPGARVHRRLSQRL